MIIVRLWLGDDSPMDVENLRMAQKVRARSRVNTVSAGELHGQSGALEMHTRRRLTQR